MVFNGRLDKEIVAAQKGGKPPAVLAREDAAIAVAAAHSEGFPPGAILFLDQEEGGRMLPEQAAYLLAWTEAVADTGYKPGVYASGQPVSDEDESGKHITITTIQDIRAHVAAQHLHPIVFWVAQDAWSSRTGLRRRPRETASARCERDTGRRCLAVCAVAAAQDHHQACGATYNRDGNCTMADAPPALAHYQLDLSVSRSPDPSHGR